MNHVFFNSKAKMAACDWTKDWSNPHLRLRLWFSIQLSTRSILYHVPYDKETFYTSIKEPLFNFLIKFSELSI